MTFHATRRRALQVLGGGITAAVLSGTATAQSNLSQELNTVRQATQQYRDVAAARNDGYTQMSPYVPGMGFDLINGSRVAASETVDGDLPEPAVLVYFTTGNYNPAPFTPHDPERDDELRLGGVEFAHDGTEGVDADYFSDEEANRELAVSEAEGWHYLDGEFTVLHVWVHRGNPAGVFHDTNPTID